MNPRRGRALVTATLLAALAACGELDPSPSAPSWEPSSAVPTPVETAASSPARVPEAFPLPPGAVPVEPDDATALATWQFAGTSREAYDFYRGALAAAGYSIEVDAPGGEAATFIFTTADGERLELGMYSREGGTRLVLHEVHVEDAPGG